ncbi:MAG: hypothetical protein NZ773_00465 [Dehalococcoidia bacterium]|nr:hypothetical protein [Dehalococcoidia bacterium]
MNRDPGREILNYVYRRMRIDAEWCQWGERGFTWWGSLLSQTVWAEPPQYRIDREITRLHCRMPLLRNVKETPQLREMLDLANGTATLSALDWHAETGTIALHASVYAHTENVHWLQELFTNAVALQAAESSEIALVLLKVLGGELAVSAHPTSGIREIPDGMMSAIKTAYLPGGGDKPVDLTLGFDLIEREYLIPSLLPYSRSDGVVVAPIPLDDRQSTFVPLQIDGRDPHPRVGYGAWFILKFPQKYDRLDPIRLNRLEIEEQTSAHLLGGWARSPEGRITFVSFLPALICFPIFFDALFLRSLNRAEWLHKKLGRRSKRSPA